MSAQRIAGSTLLAPAESVGREFRAKMATSGARRVTQVSRSHDQGITFQFMQCPNKH